MWTCPVSGADADLISRTAGKKITNVNSDIDRCIFVCYPKAVG